jgi:hypothetical protein
VPKWKNPKLVWLGLQLGLLFAWLAVDQELNNRAIELTNWHKCTGCHKQIWSKGFRPRQMETLIGRILRVPVNG